MAVERGETTGGNEAKGAKPHKFLGSLRDALMAAGREDTAAPPPPAQARPQEGVTPSPTANEKPPAPSPAQKSEIPSAEEAARLARTGPEPKIPEGFGLPKEADAPPTTRVIRPEPKLKPKEVEPDEAPRTVLVRGKQKIEHGVFERDPVVGFLIVVGGPGIGSYRPIYEGNNTVGRSRENRIPLDFGDDAISNEALWAYRTNFKTSVQATPFRLAYGLEAVMPVEFQIPSLRIQVRERMPEEESEQVRLQQLLALGKTRVNSLAALELEQLRRTAFVDRHRGRNEKKFGEGTAVLVF